MMPEMDGFQVLERLRADAALRTIPVIMISAVDEIDAVARAIELGATDYLPKPFNAVVLRARVTATLEKKRLEDAARHRTRELERELEIGRQIQTEFLPESLPQPVRLGDRRGVPSRAPGRGRLLRRLRPGGRPGRLRRRRRLRQGSRRRALHGPLPQPPAFSRRAPRRRHAGRVRGPQHRRAHQRLHRADPRAIEHVRDDLLRPPRPGDRRARLGQRRPGASGASTPGRIRSSG